MNTIIVYDLHRIRILRDSVLDLSICIDDVDAELDPLLAERTRLDTQLREVEAELRQLLQRWAA